MQRSMMIDRCAESSGWRRPAPPLPLPLPAVPTRARASIPARALSLTRSLAVSRAVSRAVSLTAALALAACGGGGGGNDSSATPPVPIAEVAPPSVGSARTLTCEPGAVHDLAVGAIVNNMWNQASAGAAPYRQCLQVRDVGTALEYGWTWQWPAADGIYAYPELLVGSSPWLPEPSNDARFPRTVAATRSLVLSYELLTTSTGKQAAAADFWFTETRPVAFGPAPVAVKAEMLIWTDVSPGIISADEVPAGVVEIDGRRWRVYLQAAQRDLSSTDSARWTLISYVAADNAATARYDAAKFFQDAVGRGVISATDYVSGVEIGHEIISGAGSAWLRNVSIAVE